MTRQYTSPLLAVMALSVLAGLYWVNRYLGISAALIYLILLGDIRRIVGWLTSFPTNDPLLLVAPAFVVILVLPVFYRLRLSDKLSKAVFALIAMMFLQMFNPGQGGILVGFSGALFYMVPLLWFWVGRKYGNEDFGSTVVYRIMIPAAVAAALLGIYQIYFGLLPWEQAWVDHASYAALYIGGKSIRSIGFSTSSQEYANLLLMSSTCCFAGLVVGKKWLILPLSVILPALFLASSRGSIIHLVLAVVLILTFKSRNKATLPIRFVAASIVVIGGGILLLSNFANYKAGASEGAASYAIAHQVNGLSHPLDSRYSTAGLHSAEIMSGLLGALKHPIGYGTGETSIASKFSTSGQVLATEFDISDQFINLGLPGGLLYLLVVILSIKVGYDYLHCGRRDLSLAVFALYFSFLGDWLFPGEYGNGPLLWILIGTASAEVYRFSQRRVVRVAKVRGSRGAMVARPVR